MRTNLRPSARAIDWPSEVLPTPGGPTKQRIWPETSLRSFATARCSTIRSFTFSRSKWSSVEHLARVARGRGCPRSNVPHGSVEDPLEVGADHAVLGRRRRQPLEPRELALGGLPHVLRELERLEPLAQLVHLGLLGVALAELGLDRLQLLAQEVLALALLHLGLHLRLDLRAELEHLELAARGSPRSGAAASRRRPSRAAPGAPRSGSCAASRRRGARARSGRRRSPRRAAAPRAGTARGR